VYSLKPSYGVVPDLGYLDHVGGGTTRPDINVFGPMARSAEDLELLMSVLAGPNPDDAVAWRIELPECAAESLAGLRVATWLDDDACRVDAEYRSMLGRAADAIADAGAEVEDAHPPVSFGAHFDLYLPLIMAATSPSLDGDRADEFAGRHRAWLRSDEQRAALRRTWAEWFEHYDVLLSPVMATPAIEHDQVGDIVDRVVTVNGETRGHLDIVQWMMVANVTYLPSAVVPIGRTAAGLPVGMQVVAPYLHDRRAMRVARLASDVVGGYEVPPGFE
jgi:amidase